MKIRVVDEVSGQAELTIEEMTAAAPRLISLETRVPGVQGAAFDLKEWYFAWQKMQQHRADREPARMTVEAVDEFQAAIPWKELGEAAFLYEQNGEPLVKGFPIRLYVPNGSSECLNVKSVVLIRFHYTDSSEEATYGFKNQITLEELKYRK
ncbi:hypothetical protein SAMN03159341_12024 [Paenibacillus sp. 1_12]|uniref:hypothetical protein n=1 Tax=Paenibacillus sp. 1_12 TaxID=1566278 RepID=UPI0008EC02B3|nr:hypothetical protein [Paenibacillus sp. 1_12]SFM19870.1 hypothetical protein SAMN03159341_12024 [Paenibacillus sp. 1_12]